MEHEYRSGLMRTFAAPLALALALLCASPGSADSQVTTLAGSGVTGLRDGAAGSASFMLPLGVAYDGAGNLYVADAAAQRIRKIAPDGTVRTIAGGGTPDASGVWVPGGYADGDAAAARFNHPSAVAVANDGRVYVADSYNHCIRVIAPDGRVSTVAGSPARTGLATGGRDAASLYMPMGLALDRAQNLYVADAALPSALRKIDRDGTVSEVKLPGHVQPPGGFAVVDDGHGLTFVVADLSGLYVSRPDGSHTVFRNEYFRVKCAAHTAPAYVACDQPETAVREHRDVGAPMGIAAYNDHLVAYTDYRTNTVRLADVRGATVRLVAGYALGDGSGRGAGAHDGPGRAATFNMPFGIAIGPAGELAVADAGSRRVRIVRDVDRTDPVLAADLARGAVPAGRRVLAYAGDVSVWQGTEWPDSVEGRLARRLNESSCTGCRTAQVVPVVLDPFPAGLAALSSLPARRFDALVLQLSMKDAAALANVDVRRAVASPGTWRPALEASLRRLDAAAKRQGARLIVLVQPLPDDVAPAAGFWGRADATSFGDGAGAAQLAAAVAAAGVAHADASREFAAAQAGASPPALFSADGSEVAAGGREALAAAALRALASSRPW